jgi:hypothetical protein
MSIEMSFTKETLEHYLKELAKEFRRRNHKAVSAEIILIGGASMLINYGFRDMTYDVDAIIHAESSMKDAINAVGDRYSLPNGWLNTDFRRTKSYTPRLIEVSSYYKTFSNVVFIRTVTSEYLIAMKLMSGRKYKNDQSDIVGILREHQLRNAPISFDQIDAAVCKLYGDWSEIPAHSKEFINIVIMVEDYNALYLQCRNEEIESKEILLDIQEKYPALSNQDDLDNILSKAKKKDKNNDIQG